MASQVPQSYQNTGVPQPLPPIRDFFPLNDLLTPADLSHYARSKVVPIAFLDQEFRLIAEAGSPRDLCGPLSHALHGPHGCQTCPVRTNPPRSTAPVEYVCGEGVRKLVAAIEVAGRTVGYVSRSDLPNAAFYKHRAYFGKFPLDIRAWLEENEPALAAEDLTGARPTVARVANRLSRRCILERRLKILRHVRRRMMKCQDPEQVLNTACRGLSALLGDVDICMYAMGDNGRLTLLDAEGPSHDLMPERLEVSDGHVGYVSQTARDKYAASLALDPLPFIQVDAANPAQCAYTTPLHWGADEVSGALQVSSTHEDALSLAERQCVRAIADFATLAGVKVALKNERRRVATLELSAGIWADLLIELTFETGDDALKITRAKKRLFAGLAREALRISAGRTVTVRMWDRDADVLRFIAVSGEELDPGLQRAIYENPKADAGAHAFRTKTELYIWDADQERLFRLDSNLSRSIYVLPIKVHGETIGVLSVHWDQPQQLSKEALAPLRRTINHFENVLDVLDTREESLIHSLERSVAAGLESTPLAQESVDRIRTTFGARDCSLFLMFPSRDDLELVATTTVKPTPPPRYRIGEGLTGSVAKRRKALRLRDAGNPEERRAKGIFEEASGIFEEQEQSAHVAGKRSFLAAPMLSGTTLIGVIRLTIKKDLTEFSQQEEILLESIANRLAAVIDSRWRQKQAAEHVKRSDRNRELVQAQSLTEVCGVLAEEFMRDTEANSAHFRIVDQSNYELQLEAGAGVLESVPPEIVRELPDYSRNTLESDIKSLADWDRARIWLETKSAESAFYTVASVAYLPFGLDTNVSAALFLTWNRPVTFDQSFQSLFAELAKRAEEVFRPMIRQRHAQMALENRVAELERLRKMSLRFAVTRNLEELIESVVEIAKDESGMEVGMVRLLDGAGLVLKSKTGLSRAKVPETLRLNPHLRRSLDSERCRFIPDASRDRLWQQYLESGLPSERLAYLREIRSLLHVPLRSQGQCIGLICLQSEKPGRVLGSVQRYLEIVGSYAGLAIETVRVSEALHRQLEAAQPLAMGGTMLSGFLHMMRNKLNDLFAILSNLKEPGLEEEVVIRKTKLIEAQLEALRSVCNDLGDFARVRPVEAGEHVHLNSLVERIIADFSELSRPPFAVVRDFLQPSPVVMGNPVQLEIACKMLVQNAIEAMPEGGELAVSTGMSEGGWMLAFRDTGVGMDPVTRQKCIEPFYSTKVDRGGTGLGLAVVSGILRQHGGRLDIKSAKGGGSRFTMIFPRKEIL